MDSRRPTPTVLASQAYSPLPPPPPLPLPAPQQEQQSQVLSAEDASDWAAEIRNTAQAYYQRHKGEAVGVSSRQPLQESTGNAQHHQVHHHQAHVPSHYPPGQYPLPSLPSTRSCTPSLPSSTSLSSIGPLGPPPAPIPTPPVLGSNVLGYHAAAGPSAVTGGSLLRRRRYHDYVRERNRNPIYYAPEFAQYRQKQKDKEKQTWPDMLESAFLDAVLLVLFMGRRKYHMDNKQHGRNMIISEYIWRRWLALLPPGTKEPSKYRNEDLPDNNPLKWNPWYRWRKQVSSHMQVMKGFFKFHPSFCFFFLKGQEEGTSKDKKKVPVPNRWYKENTDQRSFRNDPVLSALEQKRLPSVRPNYKYFEQLLAMRDKVQIQPTTCWIYVANDRLRDQPVSAGPASLALANESKAPSGSIAKTSTEEFKSKPEDVSGTKAAAAAAAYAVNLNGAGTVVNTYHATKGLLYRSDFPHRYAFNNPPAGQGSANCESPWVKREAEVCNIRHTLLHEYTFPLRQTESASAREVLDEWEHEHPDLHRRLSGVIASHELANAHELPTNQLVDIIHVDVTFDIHRVRCLPEGTSFEWPFKIQVAQQALQCHDWCVRTWLERPVELARRSKGEAGRGKTVVATKEEKSMLKEITHVRGCGADQNHQLHCDCRNRHQRSNTWLVPIPAITWAESLDMCAQFPTYFEPKKRGPNGGRSSSKKEVEMPESDTVTQMDLMRGTAMFQELYSRAPLPPDSLEQPTWTRRAVIVWTFNTIHFFDKDKNVQTTPAGSTWRFLTAIDPLSKIHQDRIYLSGDAQQDLSYQQILNSQMTDDLGSVWSMPSGGVNSAPASMPVSPMAPYGPSPLHVHGNFANGLVTPPPSAALPSTYAFEGAPSIVHSQSLGRHQGHIGYIPVSSIDNKSSYAGGDSFDTESYLQGTGHHGTFYEKGDDNESDTTLQGEATDLSGFGAQQWPATHAANPLDWDSHGLHSLSMVAEEELAGSGNAGEHRANAFDDNVQHLQHSYDPFAQLRAEARERRTQSPNGYLRHEEQSLRNSSYDRRLRQEGVSHDAWHTAASLSTGDNSQSQQGYSQHSPAQHLSQSTMGWNELSQIHPPQPHRDDGLPEPSRALQDFGSASGLSPLLNRKRRRDEDGEDEEEEEGGGTRYALGPGAMPSYANGDDGRYAPTAIMDRHEGDGW